MISILQHFLFGFDGINLCAETLLLSAFYIILSKDIQRFILFVTYKSFYVLYFKLFKSKSVGHGEISIAVISLKKDVWVAR